MSKSEKRAARDRFEMTRPITGSLNSTSLGPITRAVFKGHECRKQPGNYFGFGFGFILLRF